MIVTRKKQAERYPDCQGLAFDDVRAFVQKHFGPRTSDWPSLEVVKDAKVCELAHERWRECWNCGEPWTFGRPMKVEAHHIIGAARRSDEFCNIAMLCYECHGNVKTGKLPQGRILFLKHKHDRQHCDWARLCLLGKRFLPDLIAANPLKGLTHK